MNKEKYYSIGQVSKICDVSARMLRYYEQIGLIMPDRISEETGYRYYTISTMRDVQTIRYFVAQGFSLDEIKQIFPNDDLEAIQDAFLKKIDETKKEIEYRHQILDSLKGWCSLIIEGKDVLRHRAFMPNVKYISETVYFCYERERDPQEVDSDMYLETEYFTESKNNGHDMVDVGGAFNFYYSSWQERAENTYREQKLLQIVYENTSSLENTIEFGGFNAVCAYHIGSKDNIGATYEKLVKWAGAHRFSLRGDCLERDILDIFSTQNREDFVTEILLPLEEETVDLEIMSKW